MGLMVIWWLLKRNYWSNCSAGHKSAFCTALIAGGWCTCEAARRNVPNCTLHTKKVSVHGVQNRSQCGICEGKWCWLSGCAGNSPRQVFPWKNAYPNLIVSRISLSLILIDTDGL